MSKSHNRSDNTENWVNLLALLLVGISRNVWYIKLFTWYSLSIVASKCWILPCRESICSLLAVIFSCMSMAACKPEAEQSDTVREAERGQEVSRALHINHGHMFMITHVRLYLSPKCSRGRNTMSVVSLNYTDYLSRVVCIPRFHYRPSKSQLSTRLITDQMYIKRTFKQILYLSLSQ